jgi:hypothetical protein
MRQTGNLTAAILAWLLLGACSPSVSATEAQVAQTEFAPPAATTETSPPVLASTATSTLPPPAATPTEQAPAPSLQTPTQSALPTNTLPIATIEPLCDMAGFINDVTIPDGTEVEAGSTFTKTWRLRNDGTCPWNADYRIVFSDGDSLDGPDSAEFVTEDIVPGKTVDISLDLTAPDEPGDYTGYWMLENADGDAFGIGRTGASFWVKITVPE